MQLMTINSLVMFDIVFVFFLFLVGISCLMYYLPNGHRIHDDVDMVTFTHKHKDNKTPVDEV